MPFSNPTSKGAVVRGPRILTILLALLASVALVAGACSSDEKSSEGDEDTQTSEDPDDGTATDETGGTDGDGESSGSEGTGGDAATGGEDFSTAVQAASGQLEAATDPCEVFDAVGLVSEVNGPEGSDDARAATDYYILLLNKMADTSSDPQVAETLRAGATAFEEYAESVDYDPEALDLNGEGPGYSGAEETEAAMDEWLNAELTACIDPSLSVPPS